MGKKTIEDSAFFDLFGKSQNTKVLDLLIEQKEERLCFSDIAERANIKRERIRPIMDLFSDLGIVKTSEIRNMKLYQLDDKNFYAQQLVKLYEKIIIERDESKEEFRKLSLRDQRLQKEMLKLMKKMS